jgi:predicted aspartyl protease
MRAPLRRVCAFWLASVAAAAAAEAPQQPKICNMGELASLDTTTSPEGMLTVRAAVDGHEGAFLLDTGGMGTWLAMSTAAGLKHLPEKAQYSGQLIGGTTLDYGVHADSFAIGPQTYLKRWFLIVPDKMLPGDAVGGLQPRALGGYDTEIDFLKGKLNLFEPAQCPGHVVYWTREAYAAVPMSVDEQGHITVKAVLDGKPIDALIDTGSQASAMSVKVAHNRLSLDETAPGMAASGMIAINGVVAAKKYRYPFKTLTFEGIAIANPRIEIDDTGNDSKDTPLILGIGVLRQLHMFIAYDEGLLYLTAAEAR